MIDDDESEQTERETWTVQDFEFFAAYEGEKGEKAVRSLRLARKQETGLAYIPQIFTPAELSTWDDVYRIGGPGYYEVFAYGARGVVARGGGTIAEHPSKKREPPPSQMVVPAPVTLDGGKSIVETVLAVATMAWPIVQRFWEASDARTAAAEAARMRADERHMQMMQAVLTTSSQQNATILQAALSAQKPDAAVDMFRRGLELGGTLRTEEADGEERSEDDVLGDISKVVGTASEFMAMAQQHKAQPEQAQSE